MQPNNPTLAQNLTSLAEICAQAGATASTVFYSNDHVVVFYKNPHSISLREKDSFDELHVGLQKNACILIAVFREDSISNSTVRRTVL